MAKVVNNNQSAAAVCRAGAPSPAGRAAVPRQFCAGFTLVEMLAALAILALIMGMMIFPFMAAMDYVGKGRARSQAQQNARQIMNVFEKEIGEALDIYLLPGDPAMCAFVPPYPGTFPLQPGNTVIRYWQVWRSDPNADPAAGSPDSASWYDKYNPVPRNNQATAEDTDSRYIARTEFAGPVSSASLDRSIPASTGDPILDKQYFVAISPVQANSDVPLLHFEASSQVNETLKRDSDSAYVFHSRYPLWEADWEVSVYEGSTGDLLMSFDAASDPGYVGLTGARHGEVNFAVSQLETTEDPTYPLTITPVGLTSTIPLMSAQPDSVIPEEAKIVPRSLTVVAYQAVGGGGAPINPLVLSEVPSGATPGWGQYKLNNPNNPKGPGLPPTLEIAAASLPLGVNTPVAVSYQWSVINPNGVLVIASYRTRALLKISLTMSQRDSNDGQPQDVHLERRVKLKNVVK